MKKRIALGLTLAFSIAILWSNQYTCPQTNISADMNMSSCAASCHSGGASSNISALDIHF